MLVTGYVNHYVTRDEGKPRKSPPHRTAQQAATAAWRVMMATQCAVLHERTEVVEVEDFRVIT